jgi:hypothetical protein
MTTWIYTSNAPTPVYYVYGSEGNVTYIDNTVYVDGEPQATSEEFYNQAIDLADSVPEMDAAAAENVEWLPLGMFAYYPSGSEEVTSYLQLAVSKDSIIGGTYVNEATNVSRPLEGMVDDETQRAAWRFADGKNTDYVMETGIFNLTEDTASILIHQGPDKVQEGVLVRIEAPENVDVEDQEAETAF